jgi:DNA-binding NarL/FixJ family response regulator
MIRIVIYEDTSVLRNALAGLIGGSKDFLLVGSFENCIHCESEVAVLKPDVVLMDIGLPEIDGIMGLKMIKQIHPQTEVIMFTVFEDDERIFESLENGACGYLLKGTSPQKILDAIKDIYNGGAAISPSVAKKLLEKLPHAGSKQNPHLQLSDREAEVLHLLSKGYSQKIIAANLDISINTVKTLVKRCYQKLNVNSITEAMAKTFFKKEE